VRRSAAVPVTDAHGAPRSLALYYVADPDGGIEPARLLATLVETLPGYLVPRTAHRVPTLPLNANGKIDTWALAESARTGSALPPDSTSGPLSGPQPGPETSAAAFPNAPAAPAAPHTPESPDPQDARDRFLRVFRDVLGCPEMTDTDGFFALGGDSLDAARLCTRIAAALSVVVPVSQIYRTPTPAGLAAWFAGLDGEAGAPADGAQIPLGVGQANYIHATASTICVQDWSITGPLDPVALHAALDDVHRRHEALRASYHDGAPPTARVSASTGRMELRRLPARPPSGESGDEAERAAVHAAVQEPLDPGSGRIWRAVLTEPDPSGRRLFSVGVHHIAFDGWATDLFVADLGLAYAARLDGRAPQWPAPAPGLSDLAAAALLGRCGVDLDAQRTEWQQRLRTLPRFAVPGLPRGPLPPAGPTDGRHFEITAEILRPWREERAAGGNLFSGLLAVFAATLRELTGRDGHGVLVPVARRGDPVTDAAVTCRVNPVVVRLPRAAEAGRDPLAATAEAVNEALAAQDLPFGEVIAAVARVRPDLDALLSLPIFLVQDEAAPLILRGCGARALADRPARDIPSPLAVEVALAGEGANLNVAVRTDVLPLSLAGAVGEHYLRILRSGPGALAHHAEDHARSRRGPLGDRPGPDPARSAARLPAL
jgi:hypothetical protein